MSDAATQSARQLAQALLRVSDPVVVRALAASLTELPTEVAQGVLAALGAELAARPDNLDAAWAAWAQTRHPGLLAVLAESGRPASSPPALTALSALQLDCAASLASGEYVEPLLAAAGDRDPLIAERAVASLAALTQPAAREEVCRWAIQHDHPAARQAALAGRYAPADPVWRALFFILTDQWEQYEALDFDARLLHAVYETGDDRLREKIATQARRAGWRGYVEALAGERSRRRLSDLSVAEWDVLLAMLGRGGRWAEAWQLAQAAPPLWGARILRTLFEAGWQPPGEGAAFAGLAQKALDCLARGMPGETLVGLQGVLEGHSRRIPALALHAASGLLVSASADRSLRIWSLAERRCLKTLDGHSSYVFAAAISPDGSLLASGSADRSVRLWSLPDGRHLRTLSGHAAEINWLTISPDGCLLASGESKAVRIWSLPDGALLKTIRGEINGLQALRFQPGGEQLLAASDSDKNARLWAIASGENGERGFTLRRVLMDTITGWAFHPQAGWLVSANHYRAVRAWQMPGGDLLGGLPGRADGRHLTFSSDGRLLAGSDRSAVRLWRTGAAFSDPGSVADLEGAAGLISSLAFAPSSRLLAVAGQDRLVRLWQVSGLDGSASAPSLMKVLEGYNSPPEHLTFSSSGDLLLSADEHTIRYWRMHDLGRFFRTPVSELLGVHNEAAAQTGEAEVAEILNNPELGQTERTWLELVLGLLRWQRRYDIAIEDGPSGGPRPLLQLGEFDIELEG